MLLTQKVLGYLTTASRIMVNSIMMSYKGFLIYLSGPSVKTIARLQQFKIFSKENHDRFHGT